MKVFRKILCTLAFVMFGLFFLVEPQKAEAASIKKQFDKLTKKQKEMLKERIDSIYSNFYNDEEKTGLYLAYVDDDDIPEIGFDVPQSYYKGLLYVGKDCINEVSTQGKRAYICYVPRSGLAYESYEDWDEIKVYEITSLNKTTEDRLIKAKEKYGDASSTSISYNDLMVALGLYSDGYVAKPKYSLKQINSGTGVKIEIGKTKGATGFYIYLLQRDNGYSKYLNSNGKYESIIGYIAANQKKKTVFKIDGLPEGKYTFRVVACYENESANQYFYSKAGKKKSIKIKAPTSDKSMKEKKYNFSKVKAGDIIEFGSYEQDDNMLNGKEPIEWIVLAKNNNNLFLLSKNILDCVPYNNMGWDKNGNPVQITWEKSTLRKWLSDVFYKEAFTKKESGMINTVKLSNKGNERYGTSGGASTKDKVFILSLDEVINARYGFPTYYGDYVRGYHYSEATPYCRQQGCSIIPLDEYKYFCERYITYWLRTPGSGSNEAATVDTSYGFMDWGDLVNEESIGVRPAICINIGKEQAKTITLEKTFGQGEIKLSSEEIKYYKEILLGDVINRRGEFEYADAEFSLCDLNGDERDELLVMAIRGAHALKETYIYTYDGFDFHDYSVGDEISEIGDGYFMTTYEGSEGFGEEFCCYDMKDYYRLSRDGSLLEMLCAETTTETYDSETDRLLNREISYREWKFGKYYTLEKDEYEDILKKNNIPSKDEKVTAPFFYEVNEENIAKVIK